MQPLIGDTGSSSQRSQSMRCTHAAICRLCVCTAGQPNCAMKSMAKPAVIQAAMSRVPCQSNSARNPSSRKWLTVAGLTSLRRAGSTHRTAVPLGAQHHLCRLPVQ